MTEPKKRRWTAKRLLPGGNWETRNFEDYDDAVRFITGHDQVELRLNVALPMRATAAALKENGGE